MEIQTYLKILSKRWWLVFLVTLAVGGFSFYISRLVPAKFEAETSMRVITPLGGSLGDISYQTYYADRLMNTYAQIASSEEVMSEVKKKLNLQTLPEISVKTVPNSEIIRIVVKGTDAVLVAKAANTMADTIIAKSQVTGSEGVANSQGLEILSARQSVLQKELEQAKLDREKLIVAFAQTSAEMNTLDRSVRMKEVEYQNLQDQYQKAVIDEAVSKNASTKVPFQTMKDILATDITRLETELSKLREQYQALSTSAATYSQEITSISQSVQNKESAYQNLLSQIDSAKIADAKRENGRDIMIASPAIIPVKPAGPGSVLIIGLGFLCGIIGGILLAFLWNTLDNRIDSFEQVRQLTGLPVLGCIPKMGRKDLHSPPESADTNIQRACGLMCTKILAIQQSRSVKTIAVMSPNPEEGKSTIVVAIASGLAKANRRVLVVDTDLRKSSLMKLFNLSNKPGLSSVLKGEVELADAVHILPNPCIHILSGDLEDGNPTVLLQSSEFAAMFNKFAAYDTVLFDSPALCAVPDGYNLAMQVDGIILVAQRKHTTLQDIQTTLTQLEDVQQKLLGTIINRVPRSRVSKYYYQRKTPFRLPHISIRLPGIKKTSKM